MVFRCFDPSVVPCWKLCGNLSSDNRSTIFRRSSSISSGLRLPNAAESVWPNPGKGDQMHGHTTSRQGLIRRRSLHRLAKAARTTAAAIEALETRRLLSWTPGEAPGWSISGTGDFNGDGYVDIVWRNQPVAGSPTPGQVRIQYMQGSSPLSTSDITVQGEPFHTYSGTAATATNPNFIVAATGEIGRASGR